MNWKQKRFTLSEKWQPSVRSGYALFHRKGQLRHAASGDESILPEKPPFPFLHVNTTWKFKEMIEFRDYMAKKLGIEMIEYINEEGVKQGINYLIMAVLTQTS